MKRKAANSSILRNVDQQMSDRFAWIGQLMDITRSLYKKQVVLFYLHDGHCLSWNQTFQL